MSDYISREAAIKLFNFAVLDCLGMEPTIRAGDIIKALESIPAADVREVKRGKWEDAMQSCHDSPHVKCSVCGEYYWRYFNKFNFCPNCGADMRGEIVDDTTSGQ